MKIEHLYTVTKDTDHGEHQYIHSKINGVEYRLHRVVDREGTTVLIGLQRWHTFVTTKGNTDGNWQRVSDRHLVSVLDQEL